MAKEYTTFVLGAGLSANYGFPTGARLINLIVNELPILDDESIVGTGFKASPKFRAVVSSYMQNVVNKNNLDDRKICAIGNRVKLKLQESNVSSIDSYINEFSVEGTDREPFWLNNNSVQTNPVEFNAIAAYILKGLIYLIISECEKNSLDHLRARDGNSGTYRFLYNTFFKGKSSEDLKNIKIINFNYDRSFDYVLEYFLKSDLVKAQNFENIERAFRTREPFGDPLEYPEIIHPYGSLGKLEIDKYGAEATSIHDKFDQIKVISSERSGFERPREIIFKSKAIVFLGFGFDSINIGHLGIDELKKDRSSAHVRIWFTTYGMTNFVLSRVLKGVFGSHQDQNSEEFTPEAYQNQNLYVVDSISNSRRLGSYL